MLLHIPGSDHRVVQTCDLSQHPPPTWHLPSPLGGAKHFNWEPWEEASTEQPPLKPGPQIIHQEAGVCQAREEGLLSTQKCSADKADQWPPVQAQNRAPCPFSSLGRWSPRWEGQPLSDCSAKCCLINYPGEKKKRKEKNGHFFLIFKNRKKLRLREIGPLKVTQRVSGWVGLECGPLPPEPSLPLLTVLEGRRGWQQLRRLGSTKRNPCVFSTTSLASGSRAKAMMWLPTSPQIPWLSHVRAGGLHELLARMQVVRKKK